MMNSYVSLDTNIILLDAHNLYVLGKEKTIVLTETVLAEIDNKKTVIGDIGYNAREFGRMLGKAELLGMEQKEKFHLTLLGVLTYVTFTRFVIVCGNIINF